MSLFKTSFWSAISTIIKMLAGIITTKIMAIYVGPAGIALLGNFNNITGIFSTFANGATGIGVTKYISEFESEKDKKEVVSLAIRITLICSVIIGMLIILGNEFIAKLIFGEYIYASAIIIVGLTIIFFGLNTSFTSILNGHKYIKEMIIVGIIGNLLSVVLAIIITINYGLLGALVNASVAQILIFFINLRYISKLELFEFKMLATPIKKSLLYKLFKYALMSVVSALVIPMSTLIIRTYIITNFSSNEAGYVQAVWSISSMYLMIVTTTLSIYYLPILSNIKDKLTLRKEIFKGYKFLLPIAIIGGITIILSRELIINILYTTDFLQMKNYFIFQVIGDTFKIASWILAYLMVAKAMTKMYIVTEILFSLLYLILSIVFMNNFGVVGVTYAYALNYFIYLILMVYLFRKILFKKYIS